MDGWMDGWMDRWIDRCRAMDIIKLDLQEGDCEASIVFRTKGGGGNFEMCG
jgi:hypothetical protein